MEKEAKYFPDLIQQQFNVPQPDMQWHVDYSEIILNKENRIHFLLVIDGCYNEIIKYSIAINKPISTTDTIRRLESALKERRISNINKENPTLVIHTDRGTQFTSQKYFLFTQKHKEFFQPSMSPMASPTHNAIVERFNRTLKELKVEDKEFNIQNKNICEYLQERFQNGKEVIQADFVRNIFKIYVNFYNHEKRTKKAPETAFGNNKIAYEAKEFLKEPKFDKSFSEYAMKLDPRRKEIELYRQEVVKTHQLISNLLPDNVNFIQAKPYLLHRLNLLENKIDNQFEVSLEIQEDTNTIKNDTSTIKNSIQWIGQAIQTLQGEIEKLTKKDRKEKIPKTKLRDPIYKNHYEYFMLEAGTHFKRLALVRSSQLRIVYTLLYFLGLRINEIRLLTKDDLLLALETGQLCINHYKTNTNKVHVLPDKERIQFLKQEIDFLFETNGFKYLGNSKRNSEIVFDEVHFIRLINQDMKHTCEKYQFLAKFSSHSFRAGFITKLLKTESVHKVAELIGHKSISSTMSYNRYVLNKEETQQILKNAGF